MRLLICGGRDFSDRKLFRETMARKQGIKLIIHGGAKGADTLADQWAKRYGIPVVRMDALWDFHGKQAGSLRNQAMLDMLHPDGVLAFPGGNGTADMIRRAEKAGLPVQAIAQDYWQEDDEL